ncbi:cytochrome c oxidase assembly protein [Demequina sp. SO4-13]|uniref:cytochrome c oxidase assembly protein n=1 Tax=Demequina sp. SO4-13 TaxID=3401027 RepID=UPI003AF5FF82
MLLASTAVTGAVLGVILASALPDGAASALPGALGDGPTTLRVLARVIRLGGLITLVGGTLAAIWVIEPGAPGLRGRDRCLRIAVLGAIGWGTGAALELVAVWATISPSTGLDSEVLPALLNARVGSTLAAQVLLSAIATAMLIVLAPVGTSAEASGLASGIAGISVAVYGGHGALDAAHQLAGAAIALHVIAAAMWAGGLVATLLVLPLTTDATAAIRRFGALALYCAMAVAGGGIAAGVLMNDPARLTESRYGWLLIAKAAALVGAISLAWIARRRMVISGDSAASAARIVAGEVGFLGLAVGLAAVLAQSAPAAPPGLTTMDPLLQPPSAVTLATLAPDPWGIATAVILVVPYVAALLTLRRRRDSWPMGRTVAFIGGVVVLLLVTCTGVGAYADVLLSAHMVQHMAINMVVPILLVLGAPLSLALRTLPPRPRASLLGATRSRPIRVLLHPVVVTTLFTASLFAIYFTPVFADLMATHAGHSFMLTHFLITGAAFFWMLLGVDPDPHRPSAPARLPHIAASMIAHTGFAVVLVFGSTVIGLEWFSLQAPLWAVSRLEDQSLAGGIAWGVGEFVMAGVLIFVLVRWFSATERTEAARRRQGRRAHAKPDTHSPVS